MKHYKIQRAIIIGIIVTALMAVIYNEAFGQKKQVRAILHEYEMREFLIALNPRIDNELNNDAKAILLAFSDALEENGYGRKLDSISSRHYQYSIMFNIWEKDNTRENAAELMFLKHFNSFVWFNNNYDELTMEIIKSKNSGIAIINEYGGVIPITMCVIITSLDAP